MVDGGSKYVSAMMVVVSEERRGCVYSNRIVLLCSDHPLFPSSYAFKEDR